MFRKPVITAAGLMCLAVACLMGQTHAIDKYFRIHDMAHGNFLATGASYDGDTYHLRENELGDHASWRFIDAGDGYYHIFDRRHGAVLCAGDDYDGDVYALTEPYDTRENAKWRAVPGQTWGAFLFYDKKHNKALIAGDNYDHRIYHQDPGTRLNAEWVLTMVTDGDSGPDFFVVSQELLSLEMHNDQAERLDRPPLFVIDAEKVTNNTGVTQQMTITKSKTETMVETWSFTREITWGVSQTFEVSGGVEGIADVKSSTTFSFSMTNGWTKGGETSTEHQMTWEIPVTVPPNSVVQLDGIVQKYEATVPFTALINTTLGSGLSRVDTVTGEWNGVELVTGEITFTDVTGVRPRQHISPSSYTNSIQLFSVFRPDGRSLGQFPAKARSLILPGNVSSGILITVPETHAKGERSSRTVLR
jgi:hypothetical protein